MATIITSKKAREHVAKIKARHSDILKGMELQAEKVRQYREMQRQEAMAKQERQQNILRESKEASQRDREIALKQH